MNNEPVAWMVEDDENISFIMNGNGFAKPDASWKSVIPVYTHPANELDEDFDAVCLENKSLQAEIEALNRELLRYKSNGEMGYANEQ